MTQNIEDLLLWKAEVDCSLKASTDLCSNWPEYTFKILRGMVVCVRRPLLACSYQGSSLPGFAEQIKVQVLHREW